METMKRSRRVPEVMFMAALLALALKAVVLCTGCVNGKLNPIAAKVIEGAAAFACAETATVKVGNVEVGDVCKEAVPFLDSVVNSFTEADVVGPPVSPFARSSQAALADVNAKSAEMPPPGQVVYLLSSLPACPMRVRGQYVGTLHVPADTCKRMQDKTKAKEVASTPVPAVK